MPLKKSGFEKKTVLQTNTTCLGDQPECRHGGVQRCIPQDWLCDGHRDCDHGEDEMNCYDSDDDVICEPSQYKCDNQCLAPRQLCNGVQDCRDGSDEQADKCLHSDRDPGSSQSLVAKIQVSKNISDGNETEPDATKTIPTTASPNLTNTTTVISSTTTANRTAARVSVSMATPKAEAYPENTSNSSNRSEIVFEANNVTPIPTTRHQASTVTYLKFLNFSFLEPVNSIVSQKQAQVDWNAPESARQSTARLMAKTFRSLTTEKPDIVLVRKRREANMTIEGEPISKEEEQPTNPPAPMPIVPQAVEETELEPVKSVVGVPIKPMNL
nr:Low density lipoprotein-receptor domain containing protein [Haemonchus contortus]